MQFIVFAAFAIVLSVPESGPPWRTITSPAGTLAVVLGQILLTVLLTGLSAYRVKVKLDREPSWLPSAQRLLAQGNVLMRITLLSGFIVSVYGTAWVTMVRSSPLPFGGGRRVTAVWGLDEILILLPFLVSIIAGWAALYPGDRAIRRVALEVRLWAAAPARPVWGLRQFLSFMLRQNVLIILIPMVPIVMAADFAHQYSRQIRQATGLLWADQAVLVTIAGMVFLFAPVMLRYIWHTRVLPSGELRDRLEQLCRRVGLRYRRILIWESDGMVVNAAVMGMFSPVRYILLSDGLLEMMDDQKIEAVFGHEAGHVKHRHIEFYMLFAISSMLIVGGAAELFMAAVRYWPQWFTNLQLVQDYLQIGAMGLIIVVWGLGFGAVSRRFEWQADLFGARSITPPAEGCGGPCFVHGTAAAASPAAAGPEELPAPDKASSIRNPTTGGDAAAEADGPVSEPWGWQPAVPPTGAAAVSGSGGGRAMSQPKGSPVCATAAGIFAEALHRIAVLNGIPLEARSWRHSSIANRMRLLKQYASDPGASARLERTVVLIKATLLLGTVAGLGIAMWLYWPK